MPLNLSPKEYQRLIEVSQTTHDPRQLHRAQALLWLHEGDTVEEVATRLCTTPRTVFRWTRRFHDRQALELPARLADGPRSGRPTTVHGIIDTLISAVIDGDPRHLGYHSTVWTAPLLRQYLHDVHHIEASRRSVGLALGRLGIAWKRPRYDLARRAPTWRQAKGGSNGALQAASGRWS
jgi:transposase